jgi:hypothetical protein
MESQQNVSACISFVMVLSMKESCLLHLHSLNLLRRTPSKALGQLFSTTNSYYGYQSSHQTINSITYLT